MSIIFVLSLIIKYNKEEYVYNNIIKSFHNEQTLEEKIQVAFLNELKETSKNDIYAKLTDFKILKVDIIDNVPEAEQNKIIAYVTYNVKPAWWAVNTWIAGNGKKQKSWIIEKQAYVNLQYQNNGELLIIDMGTNI